MFQIEKPLSNRLLVATLSRLKLGNLFQIVHKHIRVTGVTEGQILAEDAHTNRTHVAHFEDLAVTETSGRWRDFEFRRKH